MKPCQHCGSALPNGAISCLKCGKPWEDRVHASGSPKAPEDKRCYTLWLDIALIIILTAFGYYFLGGLGALGGAGLGVIAAFGYFSSP